MIMQSSIHTHSEVHEAQELLQHLCHDGEIAFRKVLSHSSHVNLWRKDKVSEK